MVDIFHTIVLIVHVLGAAIIIGVAFVSLIIQIKPPLTKDYIDLLERIWKISGISIGVQILTGLYLAFCEWDKLGNNPLFWTKMFLVFVVGGIVGIVSNKKAKLIKESDGESVADLKWAWIGLLTFAVIASIGVIMVETIQ